MSNTDPSISFVVTSYRKPERLRTCLEALDRQVYQRYEVVVTDDGSDTPENRELAEQFGAKWVTKEHTFLDGVPVKDIPEVLNQGVAIADGDIIQTLQQDHVVAPDFGLWLVRGIDYQAVTFGWTDHRWGGFTTEDLDGMLRNLHLPDGEIRYLRHFYGGRATHREVFDWKQCDGLDAAVAHASWQDLDSDFIGQDHSWLDWLLRMQLAGLKLVVNPLMRLWHMEEPESPAPEEWRRQIQQSYELMQRKYDPDVWSGLVHPPIWNAREQLKAVQREFGVEP